jgi:16S rRNA (guanine966-N2)-methyltransferase
MIRITGGALRGRRLRTMRGTRSRPTLGRIREAVFDILGPSVAGKRFVDLFAGVGAMGIEALSRGAREAVFVEKDPACLRLLEANLEALGLGNFARVVRMDAREWLARNREPLETVFVDPPYASGEAARVLDALGRAAGAERVVIQHGPREVLPEASGALRRLRSRSYGDSRIEVYGFEEPGGSVPGPREEDCDAPSALPRDL